jgi:retron-type reverse transcriptase
LPGNYRPISVLPILSKIFEKHFATHLYLYLSKYRLLHESQSGFRCKHSCHMALTNLTDRWLKYIDDRNLIGTVFLDLKKAFDMVDHKLLCKKLQYYKISTNSMKWFESYLSLRKHNSCIGNNISNPEPVKYGVPQGSILDPLLFIIFINDLPLENLTSEIDMYADDTKKYILN